MMQRFFRKHTKDRMSRNVQCWFSIQLGHQNTWQVGLRWSFLVLSYPHPPHIPGNTLYYRIWGNYINCKKFFLFNGTTSSPLAIWTSNKVKGGTDLLYKDQCPVSLGKETLQNTQNLSLRKLVRDIDESDLSHVGLFHEITNPSLLQLSELVH